MGTDRHGPVLIVRSRVANVATYKESLSPKRMRKRMRDKGDSVGERRIKRCRHIFVQGGSARQRCRWRRRLPVRWRAH